jgi:acetyltransferase
MKLFMEPRSAAVIGVSRHTGPGSFNILENLVKSGFAGQLYAVNPYVDDIMGRKAYPSVKDVAEDIDLAVVSTPRSVVPRIVQECTEKGIKAIIVVGQGFADGDEEGRRLQAEILRVASRGGARILGPNTFGTANAFNRFTSVFAPMIMKQIPIGIICQTGFYFVGLPNFVVVGKAIDLGNACDIDFADALEYFEHDPDIRLIFMHIEGIRDGRRFVEVARRVTRKKPILALKTGKGKEGARAAQSHTGSLVGRDEVYDAAFRQCGVIRVSDTDEFEDLAKAFLNLPPMKGKGVAVITITGAGGIMATDLLEDYDLRLAKLSAETLDRIDALAPTWLQVGNPADIWPAFMIAGHPAQQVFATTMESCLNDEDVSGIIVIFAGFPEPPAQVAIDPSEILPQGAEKFREKPIVIWLYGPKAEALASRMERTGRVLVYPTLERAVRALSRLNQYWEYGLRT